ncbi:MAG: HPr kinase/phosphorylase [Janthinobacterium lividum]
MLIHASCAARDGSGVLLTGVPGSGKSDLLLRLIDRGYSLVADDQVEISDGVARPPAALQGLLEIRGLGIVRLPYSAPVPLILEVELALPDRLPQSRTGAFGCPIVMIDPSQASAVKRLDMALDCALGHVVQHTGAFTPW